jgi:hypothetical protein
MTLYVVEQYGAANYYRQPLVRSPIASYALSSASTAPFPQTGTSFILVSADAGMYLSVNSTSTGVTLTSTNSIRIPANVAPIRVACSSAFRIQAMST